MKPPGNRKTRYDKGSIKSNDRDIYLLSWTAEMYATPFLYVVDLAREMPGPGANPEGISVSAVRQMVSRWRRAGWVGYRQFLADELPYIWMTRAGLAAFGFSHYKAAPPAISRLRHIYAVNAVRMDIEEDGDEWISERAIRAGLYPLPLAEEETRHIPDGIVRTDTGDQVIEVELVQKKPAEIYKKMHALIHAWDKQAFAYAYSRIRYFTPDMGIKRALESARASHAEHYRERAELVEIELLELD